jgi:recombinational DNA repair protein RecT
MAKKSAFRRHSKWLPIGRELRDAIEKDNDAVDIPRAAPDMATISVDAFRPSIDENRGHDATAPAPEPETATAAPAPEPETATAAPEPGPGPVKPSPAAKPRGF